MTQKNIIQETAEQTFQRQLEIEASVRELFAKLLATENISVIHTNVPTPCFDLASRTLKLPDWKNISKDLYVMMIAHEVAHALHTPMNEWQEAIRSSTAKNKRVLKDIINVVEDSRIEKLIQIRYPGTKKAFLNGYEELLKKFDLFKFDSGSLSSRSLVDRINLYFKITKYGGPAVPFSEDEKLWILKIESCRSFQDVLKISQELYADIKEKKQEQQKKSKPQQSSKGVSPQNEGDVESEESSDDSEPESDEQNSDNNSEASDDEKQSPSSDNKENSKSENSKQNESEDSDKKESEKSNDSEETEEESDDGFSDDQPTIQDVLDEAKNQLETSQDKDYRGNAKVSSYVNLPISKGKNKYTFIVEPKKVHEQIKNYYSGPVDTSQYAHCNRYKSPRGVERIVKATEAYDLFKQKHRATITSMVNLFEMKKRAALYSRTKTSKTGLLNLNKIHSYKFNDDVFKKMTVTPEGKNHGMIMFIDLSGSMSRNISGTFEQTLIMCMFCKKVGIPFDVYGFTNSTYVDFKFDPESLKDGDLIPEFNFSLRHYLSSKMSLKEFNESCINVFALALSHDSGNDIPPQESLGQTPLNSCVAYSYEMIKKFKSDYNLDIVNAIYLTDGDATDNIYYKKQNDGYNDYDYSNNHRSKNIKVATSIVFRDPTTGRTWNSFARDVFHRNKKQNRVRRVPSTTPTLLEIVGTIEGVNVIGFFVSQSKYDVADDFRDAFKKDGFLKLNDFHGYKNYYIVKGGKSLNVESDSFEFEKGASLRKIRSAYLKAREKTVTNKVLLNKFIENISEY